MEQKACRFLLSAGIHIITRNFRTPFGEIDIIGKDANEFVFFEVKYRQKNTFYEPYESVSPSKQKTIRKTASYYLQSSNQLYIVPFRFDIISITGKNNLTFQWLKHAF